MIKRRRAGRSMLYGGIIIILIGMLFLFVSIWIGAIVGTIGILLAALSINIRHTRI